MKSNKFSQLSLEKKESGLLLELAANNDNATKIIIYNRLGILFCKTDIDKSIYYFDEAAKLGSVEDEFNCGYFLNQKSLILKSKNPEEVHNLRKHAKAYYKRAAKKDHKKAIINYYNMCVEDEDEDEGRYFIRRNADNGNVNSMVFIAKLLEKNAKTKNLSLTYYKMAANNCKKNEAMLYANKIVQTNLKEAIIYYKVSISKGSIKACFPLAKIFKVNNQIDIAIEYYKTAVLLLNRKKANQELNEKEVAYEIKAHYKIGKLYYKKYQDQVESDRYSSLQSLQRAEFYLMPIFEKSPKASQILFSIIEIQKEDLGHQEYIKLIKLLGLNGVSSAVKIYFNETNDYDYIKQAITSNSDDPYTNYIYGSHENDIEYIKKASNLGSPEASYDYAIYLYSQLDPNDPVQVLDESFRLLNYAYENGISKAAGILGILYYNDWVNDDDGNNKEKALELLEEVQNEDERAMLIVKEIKSNQIQRRNSSKYSVFL